MQLPEFFKQLPTRHLRSSVRAAMICQRLGMPHAHVLAHRAKPCANELRTRVAAYHGRNIKHREPMPNQCLRHGLGLQPHSVLVPLVLVLGFFARNRHHVSAVAVDCQNNTIKDLAFHSDFRHRKDIH